MVEGAMIELFRAHTNDKVASDEIDGHGKCNNWGTRIMKRTSISIATLVFAALLSSCVTIKTGSHHDESATFADYSTFAWIADNPLILGTGDRSTISPLSQKKIVQAIEDELSLKGFTYIADPDEADFVVSYTVGTREKIDETSYPVAYRGIWGWHMYGHYYYQTEVVHRKYTEGTLGIDVFDGNTKQPVWHGWASKSVTSADREDPSPVIQKAVAAIIKRFPPGNMSTVE